MDSRPRLSKLTYTGPAKLTRLPPRSAVVAFSAGEVYAIAEAIRRLIAAANVSVNRRAAEAGLAMLQAGGDFADGVIAHDGAWLGGDAFVSFDRLAVQLLRDQGREARLLA